MQKRWIILGLGAGAVLMAYLFAGSDTTTKTEVLISPEKGLFQIDVITTGELEAKNSIRVLGPAGLQSVGIWQTLIDDIVEEGTLVDKGGYIATLDKSGVMDKVQSQGAELDQSNSRYIQKKLDTALTLREARDQIVDLGYAIEEKEIELEQSAYEPPATVKKKEIELEKAERELFQAKDNYKLKVNKAVAETNETYAAMNQDRTTLEFLNKLSAQFVIKAPEPGMVIYFRDWDGKRKKGSRVPSWSPVVATLPDLSQMISRTYVNEIDVRKIEAGHEVNIGLDALPDKSLSGVVLKVANVGEQRPNSDAKVFEVRIEIHESDSTLRPGMTTSNQIISEVIQDAIHIPLESIHSIGDTLTFVYKKSGLAIIRQEVRAGKSNEDQIIITEGIDEGDRIYLSLPADPENMDLMLLPPSADKLSSSQ